MKITCPNGCEGGKFYTSVLCMMEYTCDSDGQLLDRGEFVSGPDQAEPESVFVCSECDAEAEVTT